MNVLAKIKSHGSPLYMAVQGSLLISSAAAVSAAFLHPEIPQARWLAAAAAMSSALGAGLLSHLRHSVTHRLREAEAVEAERRKLIETDLVTGAVVRRIFLDLLNESVGTMRQRREAILLLVDLDHFKQLNDSFGHQLGDRALSHLVECMRWCFPDCTLGRLGGDEFGIIMPGNDIERAMRRTGRLIGLLSEGVQHEGSCIPLSASIGVAAAPAHTVNSEELIQLADLALYESKSGGRGRATLFDEEMLSEKRYRRFLERELRAAIYLNELEVHYQPVTDASRTAAAVEGLVRWRHPVRGMIPPSQFIPVAERSNLIDLLGAWVFRRACLDAPTLPAGRIGINVSGEQLKRDEIVTMMRRVLNETGCDAARFTLEITETVATAATPQVIARIETLRAMGFQIALDDFGTGHCGFNYLKELPIDCIKIDRSYIRELGERSIAQVFVSALTQVARLQGLTIVAEGIETEAEFELAKAAGCNQFQGFLLGRPQPKLRPPQPAADSVREAALVA
ncbi:putative bifunctional diguanylate cyclase/phosphodiesterase [Chelativorans intermedius]|uniref:Bifunctional diguanylate cyclase/phosphodiesterase n=1 Tax=Chelativorans intermedius TaxID=515947 RepID=A0ABV6D363_9HYPH|nr:EAL domain-containing protein [Chelativorans intermedius]MCT8998442.1 EAL domain-containing protein [Chelativorans intermedius]